MRPGMIFKVDGKIYQAVRSAGCRGCVGDEDAAMCAKLPFCSSTRNIENIIYKEVPDEKVKFVKDQGVDIPDMTGMLEGDGVMVGRD